MGSELSQRRFPELLAAVDVLRQRLENLRTQGNAYGSSSDFLELAQGGSREFTLDAAIAFSSILLLIKEIAEDLNQMAQDWPSYPPRI